MLSFINTWIADGVNKCKTYIKCTYQYLSTPNLPIEYSSAPRQISGYASQNGCSYEIAAVKSQYRYDCDNRRKAYLNQYDEIKQGYQRNYDDRRRIYLSCHDQVKSGYLAERKWIKPSSNTSNVESQCYHLDRQYESDLYLLKDQYEKDTYALKDQYEKDTYALKDQYEKDTYALKDQYEKDLYLLKEQCNKKLLLLGCYWGV
jgi:hypothetical protein